MINREENHREIKRNILCLRAGAYRQIIHNSVRDLSVPLSTVGAGAQWFIKGKELAFLLSHLKTGEGKHPFLRVLLGLGVLGRLWWKSKK